MDTRDTRTRETLVNHNRRSAKWDVLPLVVLWLLGWIPVLHPGKGFAWATEATLGMVVLGITSWFLTDHYEHYRQQSRRVRDAGREQES